MKHVVALICALGVGYALAADEKTVKGELLFDSAGLAQVVECGSDRVFTLGAMASNPYFGLRQMYKEASDGGRLAVFVEVKGSLARNRTSNGGLVLDSPDVAALGRGTCADAMRITSLERKRGT